MSKFDIVLYLEKFETDNGLKLQPLENYKLKINSSPGNKVDFQTREKLLEEKDFFMTATKIRRSRNELQDLQKVLSNPTSKADIDSASRQFEIRDKLRFIILDDDKCIWNHTEFKKCESMFLCLICKMDLATATATEEGGNDETNPKN